MKSIGQTQPDCDCVSAKIIKETKCGKTEDDDE
jgi:hypothetical protein